MAVIELVLEPYSPKQATVKEAEQATAAVAADTEDAASEDAVAGDEEVVSDDATVTEDADGDVVVDETVEATDAEADEDK